MAITCQYSASLMPEATITLLSQPEAQFHHRSFQIPEQADRRVLPTTMNR